MNRKSALPNPKVNIKGDPSRQFPEVNSFFANWFLGWP